jgi:hypothetical protein
MDPAGRANTPRVPPLVIIGAALVVAYFFRFVGPGLSARLAADDPMNIYGYWRRGPGELVRNLFLFFTTYTRPMGGVYYSLLYHFFGLNPFPYHVVTTCLLLLNTYLAYRFAVLLTDSRLTGGLCALLVAYHAGLAWLVYLPSYIYDVLCFTFYFLAFNLYLAVRRRGDRMSGGATAVFLLLYIGALESKEMAVTLPVMVLLYEALYHGPGRWSWRTAARWARTEALPGVLAGVVTLVFLAGKTLGPDSLTNLEAYRPVFTLERYLESTTAFLNTLFYQPTEGGFFGPWQVLLAAVLLLAIAWKAGQKHLLLMWFFIFITPLPITFLPGRGGGCLYIPLVGWAIFLGSLLVSLAGMLAKAPLLRALPPAAAPVALALAFTAWQWSWSARQEAAVMSWMQDEGKRTAAVLQQIQEVQPAVRPGARIYVRNDVFPGYDTKYLFELNYRDRSVEVWLEQQAKFAPADLDKMDYIFAFENGALKRVKGS